MSVCLSEKAECLLHGRGMSKEDHISFPDVGINSAPLAISLVLETILMFTPGIRNVGNVPQIFLNSCSVGIYGVWSVLRIQPVYGSGSMSFSLGEKYRNENTENVLV